MVGAPRDSRSVAGPWGLLIAAAPSLQSEGKVAAKAAAAGPAAAGAAKKIQCPQEPADGRPPSTGQMAAAAKTFAAVPAALLAVKKVLLSQGPAGVRPCRALSVVNMRREL